VNQNQCGREIEKQVKANNKKRIQQYEAKAIEAEKFLYSLPLSGYSPYLDRKAVNAYGLRFGRRGDLFIPLRDALGLVWSYQIITANKKFFMKGGRIKGCFHIIGELEHNAHIGVLSACCAKRFVVSPKEGWNEPVNIYAIVALPPASNKSLVLRECLKPLVVWESLQREQVKGERIRQQSLRKSQEEVIQAKRKKLANLKGQSQQEAFSEIVELEENLPEVSPIPQLFANDATPESLSQSVAEQGGRFAIFSDEAGILSTLGGLYTGGSANVDILLKGIDGGHLRTRRKEHSFDLNPYLTLMLAIQPHMLKQMASKSAFKGNGVLERFLYVMPNSQLGYRSHQTAPVPESLKQFYHQFIEQLLNQFQNSSESEEELAVLQLSSEAKQLWQQFQASVEKQLRPEGRLYAYSGWGGKVCGYSLRLAGLLHIAEGESHSIIMEKTMQRAITMANHLIEHICITFPFMGIGDSHVVGGNAEKLWDWLNNKNQMKFSKTEITLGLRQQVIGRKNNLNPALEQLINRNYLKIEIDSSTKRPTTYFCLNPLATTSAHSPVPSYG